MDTNSKRVGRLTKISDNYNNLRTNGDDGYFLNLPNVDNHFMIFAEPLEPETEVRIVSTSPVTVVERIYVNGSIIFHTLNSKYLLEIFPETLDKI